MSFQSSSGDKLINQEFIIKTIAAANGGIPIFSESGVVESLVYRTTVAANSYADEYIATVGWVINKISQSSSPISHTHIISDVTGLQDTLNTKENTITNLPVSKGGTGSTSTPTNGQLLIGNGTGFTLANITGGSFITVTNTAGGITIANNYSHPTGDGNLHVPATSTNNNLKVLKAGATAGSIAWGSVAYSELLGVPSTFAPSAHTHVIADVTGLQTALNAKEDTANKGVANGYASLDAGAKVPLSQLPDSVIGQVEYKGTYNASTNTPALPNATTVKGHYYVVSVDGTQQSITFNVGDWVISNGTTWEKVDNTDSVATVFGRSGAILAAAGDYTASQITNTPYGNIQAITVQAAINELDDEKAAVGHTHAVATTGAAGFMSSADKSKLDGIDTQANKYSHPTDDGNLHVPATSTNNNGKYLKAGATAGSLSWSNIAYSELTGIPSTFTPSTHSHSWTDITSKPSTFAPSAHTHVIDDVTGLQTALNGKAAVVHTHLWADITNKPSTFAPDTHTHAMSDITGLSTALSGKSDTNHTHTNYAYRELSAEVTKSATGWYTIAQNSGNRATGQFVITDRNSSDHQSVHFIAGMHFGNSSDAQITVLNNSNYSATGPFDKIRLVYKSTYDQVKLQIYVSSSSTTVRTHLYRDDQVTGWDLVEWVLEDDIPQGYLASEITINDIDFVTGRHDSDKVEIKRGGHLLTTGNISEAGQLLSTKYALTGHTHAVATTGAAGFMSNTDKSKLDGIAASANNYSHPTDDGNLHVPATSTNNNGKFLMAGATAGSLSWVSANMTDISGVITDIQHGNRGGGSLHAVATTGAAGFMSSTDKLKLDGIAANANNYSHPTDDGNLHVPATSTNNNLKVLKAGATAGSISWGSVAYSELTGVPSTFIPSAHTHAIADVTNLQTTLDGKLSTTYLTNRNILNPNTVSDTGVGVYHMSTGATSKPTGTDHSLLSLSFNSNWTTQMAGDWRTNKFYTRVQTNGVWTGWETLATESWANSEFLKATGLGTGVLKMTSGVLSSSALVIGDLPTGTTSSTVALGNHNHDTQYGKVYKYTKTIALNNLQELANFTVREGVLNLLISVQSTTPAHSGTSLYSFQGGYGAISPSWSLLKPMITGRGHGDSINGFDIYIKQATWTVTFAVAVKGTIAKDLVVTINDLTGNNITGYNDLSSNAAVTTPAPAATYYSNRTLDAEALKVQGIDVSLVGHTHNLSSLTDTTITSPATNQLLQWNGTKWVNWTPTYISSYSESDTLASVTSRGATTSANITATSFIATGGVNTTGNITNGGFDFILGTADQVSRGSTGSSRALVKFATSKLAINYGNDFSGGTEVQSALAVNGITSITNSTASTSTTTGALTVTGGLGVGGAVWIGGLANIASTLSVTGAVTLGTQATTTTHAVRADRTITAGTGLTGGGDFTTNRTISVVFGTTANTVAEGNHTHSLLTGIDLYSDATTGRSIDRPTSHYSKSLTLEFKSNSVTGTTGSFAGLLTMAAYSDSSSGVTHGQLGFSGDMLRYRGGQVGSAWRSWKTVLFTEDATLAALTDVQITTPTANQMLQWNGTKWVNVTPTSESNGFAHIANSAGTIQFSAANTSDTIRVDANNGTTVTFTPASKLFTIGLATQALNLHNLATNGIMVKTGGAAGSGTFTARTITQGSGITVANGDGISGNPTISHVTQSAIDTGTLSGVNVVSRINVDTLGHTTTVSTRELTATDLGAVLDSRYLTAADKAIHTKSQYFRHAYYAIGGESADTGMTGLYDRNELTNAALRGNVTINITGAGTYTNTPEYKNILFNANSDIFTISNTDATTTKIEILVDLLGNQSNYSRGYWQPFVHYRGVTGGYTRYNKITVEISKDNTTWYTSANWSTTNATANAFPSTIWMGSEGAPDASSGYTYRYVRYTLEDRVAGGGGNDDSVWLLQLGFRHMSSPFARQYLNTAGGSIFGALSVTGAVTLSTQATTTTHAVRADRTITAGTGLTGGGNLTADRSLSVNFGTTANTVAEGNHTHSATDIGSGTLSDTRLSANVALRNQTNTFTEKQVLNVTNSLSGGIQSPVLQLDVNEWHNFGYQSGGMYLSCFLKGDGANGKYVHTHATKAGTVQRYTDDGLTFLTATNTAGIGSDATLTEFFRVNPTSFKYNGNNIVVATGNSSQFIKGNGTFDSNSYALLTHTHSATDITSGTLSDARLSTNVALKNVTNTFSTYQEIVTAYNGLMLKVSGDVSPRLHLTTSGGILMGSGSASADTNMYRGGVGILKTDGKFFMGGATADATLSVKGSGSTSATNALLVQNSAGTELLKVDDTGNTTAKNLSATTLGVSNSSGSSGAGISLYEGAITGKPYYGLFFGQTGSWGTHGYVSGDWATYFTMAGSTNRGWIFKHDSTNVLSISSEGHLTGNTISAGTSGATHAQLNNGGGAIALPAGGVGQYGAPANTYAVRAFESCGWVFTVQDMVDGGFRIRKADATSYNNGTALFTVDRSGNVVSTGNMTAYSDAKLKTNVENYENGLTKVMALRPVTYDRIDSGKHESGFIAQEVEAIDNSLVVNSDDTLSLDYSRMVVMLTKAVQEQQAVIEALQKRLSDLDNK